MAKRTRAWFFKITGTGSTRGTRFNNGNRPPRATFFDQLDSVVMKSEPEDRAKENTDSAALDTLVGHVVAASDIEAKASAPKPTDRTLVTQPSQLPTSASDDEVTVTSNDPLLKLDGVATMNIAVDATVSGRNNYLIRISQPIKEWFQNVVNYVESGITTLQSQLQSLSITVNQNAQNIVTNTQNIAVLSPGGVPNVVPVGAVMQWMVESVPTGYLLLQGQEVDQLTYPLLFALYGSVYNTGGETAGFFRLPDMRDVSARGYTTGGTIQAGLGLTTPQVFGSKFGADAHHIDADALPEHKHGVSLTTDESGNHTHPMYDNSGPKGNEIRTKRLNTQGNVFDGTFDEVTQPGGNHDHTVSGDTQNNGTTHLAHPNTPPVILIHFIVKHD